MRILRHIDEVTRDPKGVVTLGVFDGVHRGHQTILRVLAQAGEATGGRRVLITFEPHPQVALGGEAIPLLTPLEEKLDLLADHPVDEVIVLPFTRDFAEMSAEAFIQRILVEKIGIRVFVLGPGHALGREKEAQAKDLFRYADRFGFDLRVVPPVRIHGEMVSSTGIRKALLEGRVYEAASQLGRWYRLTGTVRPGEGIGGRLGFPTANLRLSHPDKLVPKDGIYAVRVRVKDRVLPGTCNIGHSPTLKQGEREIEVHIHDFSDAIYGLSLEVEFVSRIRDEERFDSVEALIAQIRQDKEETMKILSQV